MKIGSILTALILISALVVGPVFSYEHSATCKDSAGNSIGYVRTTAQSLEVHLTGETIPTSGYLEVNFYDIAAFDSLQMDVVSSTGNGQSGNAVATMSYRISDQATTGGFELSTDTHIEGTPKTNFDSNWLRYRIGSNVAAPATISGNIIIINE